MAVIDTIEADVVSGLAKLERVQLGKMAYSVLINNASGQWFYAPFIPTHIPPWVFNMTVQLPMGVQVASFVADTPPGMASAPVSAQIFRAVFYEESRPPSGFPLPDAVIGPPGPQGPQGSEGIPGFDGEDGAPGLDGAPGPPGPQGFTGATGIPGFDGEDGINGLDGAPGAPGANGLNGINGVDGWDGDDGLIGLRGWDGDDGAPGLDAIPPNPSVYPYRFRVHRAQASGTQTLPTTAFTVVHYDTIDFDNAHAFDNVTNFAYTIPLTGYYQLNMSALIDTTSVVGALYTISLFKNGTRIYDGTLTTDDAAGVASLWRLVGATLEFLNKGDVIDIRVLQTTGVNQNIDAAIGTSCVFSGHLLSL